MRPKVHSSVLQPMIEDYQCCSVCGESMLGDEQHHVCPHCHWHFLYPARDRLDDFFNPLPWTEHAAHIVSEDPLNFEDRVVYKDRLQKARDKSGQDEALMVASGTLRGDEVVVASFAFEFIGGSMGQAVGDRFVTAVELCLDKQCPLIVFVSSGGARMQEGVRSLVQMARVSAAIARMRQMGLLYITVLCHPTTGGVAASLAMLGDWIIAEPDAYISFTGSRVLGVSAASQVSSPEVLLALGHIDAIVHRHEQLDYISKRIKLLSKKGLLESVGE